MKTTKGGGKGMNPIDAFHKEQRKKEIKKNKKERKKAREVGILKKDPEKIKDQIKKLEMSKAEGAMDIAREHKKRQLEDKLNMVVKKRKEYEEKMKEHGEASTSVMFSHLPLQRRTGKEHERSKNLTPEDSVYYHPTLNPTGAPPHGKRPTYKFATGPRIILDVASSIGAGSSSNTPRPPPPPPPLLDGSIPASQYGNALPLPPPSPLRPTPTTRLSFPPLPPGPPPKELVFARPPLPPPPQISRSSKQHPPALLSNLQPGLLHPGMLHFTHPHGHLGIPRLPYGPPHRPPPMMRPPLPPGPPPPSFQAMSRPYVPQKPFYIKSAAPTVVKRPLAQHIPELTSMIPASVRVRRESTATPKPKPKSITTHAAPVKPLPATNTSAPSKSRSIDDSYSAFLEDMKALGALDG